MQEEFDTFITGYLECRSYPTADPEFLIIQPVGRHDIAILDDQIEWMMKNTTSSFDLTVVKVNDWNRELSPWEAPAVFGDQSFGSGAEDTLSMMISELIPGIRKRYETGNIPVILGGYSLAGLFSLWGSYQTDAFSAIAAVSPSVWFPEWIEYARTNVPQTGAIYLSLGDKEEKTKNKLMSRVGDCIRELDCLLSEKDDIRHVLEWNEGNHFKNPDIRLAKGLLWCMKELKDDFTRKTGFCGDL